MAAPDFWQDLDKASQVAKEVTALKESISGYEQLVRQLEEIAGLWELAVEEGEEDMAPELKKGLRELEKKVSDLELETYLSGDYDANNAIVSLHAGAGGTEAQDWVAMLLRMYLRWADAHGYGVEIIDSLAGEEAGLKSVTFLVKGKNAYGYLKSEKGVHRLVRISPFDASGRRHTSFASLDVIPEVNREDEVEINPDEIRVDTFRSSGAGGQHVNKTDSAVRITHLPTGIVVQCQNERSQHANRLTALKVLQARLLELKRRQEEEELARLRGEKREIAWGNQIRSYIFQPYTLVKDHRSGLEVGNIQAVMDGDLDPFIIAYLKNEVLKKNAS